MSDIDMDYRSSTFPKALFDGHLTAGNSDVRAANNLDTLANRWAGFVPHSEAILRIPSHFR
jgi:hypothetical protein